MANCLKGEKLTVWVDGYPGRRGIGTIEARRQAGAWSAPTAQGLMTGPWEARWYLEKQCKAAMNRNDRGSRPQAMPGRLWYSTQKITAERVGAGGCVLHRRTRRAPGNRAAYGGQRWMVASKAPVTEGSMRLACQKAAVHLHWTGSKDQQKIYANNIHL
eukprot:EG_transcript_25422